MIEKRKIYQAISKHISDFWPDREIQEFRPDLGPIKEVLPDFSVLIVKPQKTQDPWIYVTSGAWEIASERAFGIEFLLLSREPSNKHVDTLSMLAHFHADPQYLLSLGHIVKIGYSWTEGSHCNRLFVTLPYAFGPEFETCDLGNFQIYFLWAVPIYEEEENFAREHGVEKLEELLEYANVDVINPNRKAVVPKKLEHTSRE